MLLPQEPGALVQRVLGYLLPGYAEHLRQGRVLTEVAYRLQLGIRIDGTGLALGYEAGEFSCA